ncbi:MAG: DUF4829 domain-containing protein [Clostridia bacterium]
MKNITKFFLVCLIFLAGFIIFNQKYNNKGFNKENLSADWKKDAKSVMEVYINAMNTKDLELINECIFNMDGYDHSHIGFYGEKKETLKDIIYIKYIESEEVPFKTVEGRMKNGKYIYFKDGKSLDVKYKVKYIFENQPEESGINDQRYTLVKNKDGDYKIISCGY